METEKDLLILERTGENEKLYLNAVTPPVFMNSLHVFDTFEEYHDVNVFERPVLLWQSIQSNDQYRRKKNRAVRTWCKGRYVFQWNGRSVRSHFGNL